MIKYQFGFILNFLLQFESRMIKVKLINNSYFQFLSKSVVSYLEGKVIGHDPYILPGPGAPVLSHLKCQDTLAMSS